jgi:hypothetical protein
MFLLFYIIPASSYSQVTEEELHHADTTNYSLIDSSGWKLLNSFAALNAFNDSVKLDIIVFNDSDSINWHYEQYIGYIKPNIFKPLTEKIIQYQLLEKQYVIRVTTEGVCYLSLPAGNLPPENPVAIPISVAFKRNP